MGTTWDMEGKKGWNFSAFDSVADAFDALKGAYGDKGELGTIACFLLLNLTDAQRKEMRKLLDFATAKSKYDDKPVLDHMIEMFEKPITVSATLRAAAQDAVMNDAIANRPVVKVKKGKGA